MPLNSFFPSRCQEDCCWVPGGSGSEGSLGSNTGFFGRDLPCRVRSREHSPWRTALATRPLRLAGHERGVPQPQPLPDWALSRCPTATASERASDTKGSMSPRATAASSSGFQEASPTSLKGWWKKNFTPGPRPSTMSTFPRRTPPQPTRPHISRQTSRDTTQGPSMPGSPQRATQVFFHSGQGLKEIMGKASRVYNAEPGLGGDRIRGLQFSRSSDTGT